MLRRTPLRRGTSQLKRTPLKRGTKRLKRTPYRRTEPQITYHNTHPRCEISGQPAMPTPHHIDQNHSNDNPDNFFSLSWEYHIGPAEGVHVIGDIAFCERNRLTNHPKWKTRYTRLKEKQEYARHTYIRPTEG